MIKNRWDNLTFRLKWNERSATTNHIHGWKNIGWYRWSAWRTRPGMVELFESSNNCILTEDLCSEIKIKLLQLRCSFALFSRVSLLLGDCFIKWICTSHPSEPTPSGYLFRSSALPLSLFQVDYRGNYYPESREQYPRTTSNGCQEKVWNEQDLSQERCAYKYSPCHVPILRTAACRRLLDDSSEIVCNLISSHTFTQHV